MIGKTITKIIHQEPIQRPIETHQKIKKVISVSEYTTNGEFLLVVKNVDECLLTLDSQTTEHIVVKALTKVIVRAKNLIDDYYHELAMDKGSSVELCIVEGIYYIIASDGLKFE